VWLATEITDVAYSVWRNDTQIASDLPYSTLTYADTTAPVGVWSTYTIKATNSVGTSAASNTASGLRVLLPGSIALSANVASTSMTLNADKNGYAAGSYPALDYTDESSTNTIVDTIGQASRLLSALGALSTTWMPTWLENFVTAYMLNPQAWLNLSALSSAMKAAITANEAFATTLINLCLSLVITTIRRETGDTAMNSTAAVSMFFNNLKAAGLYVAVPSVDYTLTAGSGNSGDMAIAISMADAVGNPLYYAYDEQLNIDVTASSTTSVTLQVTSDIPAVDWNASNWPQGSGAATAVTVASSANLLTNGSFDSRTLIGSSQYIPDGWFVSSGTPGTDITMTNIPTQLITVASPNGNGYWQIKYTCDGKVYVTPRLSESATAAEVQAALREFPRLSAVTVVGTDTSGVAGAGGVYEYRIYFYGYPGVPETLQTVENAATTSDFKVTVEVAGNPGNYSTYAIQFPASRTTLPALCQQVTLSTDTVYFVGARVRAVGTITTGSIAIEVVDSVTGDPITDSAGNEASLMLNATEISTTAHEHVAFSFRVPASYVNPVYVRIRVVEALTINTTNLIASEIALLGVCVDDMALVQGTQLYTSGPYIAGFLGNTKPSTANKWTLTVSNDRAGNALDAMNRIFGLALRKLTPPTSGTTLIVDSNWKL
jgi:hypothetical protein